MTKNLGMYIEQLVNRTILFYEKNNIALLEKREIPIRIIKHININTVLGKLIAKGKVDYFGFINKKYVEIECKQTSFDYFDLKHIKKHQMNYLKKIHELKCLAYLLIYFEKHDEILAIDYQNLIKCKKIYKTNLICYENIKKNGTLVKIIYPGILDLTKLF